MNLNTNTVNTNIFNPSLKNLEERFQGELDIHIEPYAEISTEVECVLGAIADGTALVDLHHFEPTPRANPYTLYALFYHRNKVHICPVHNSYPTSLNPITLNENGHLELTKESVGGVITADQLDKFVKENYLVGYVKVIN